MVSRTLSLTAAASLPETGHEGKELPRRPFINPTTVNRMADRGALLAHRMYTHTHTCSGMLRGLGLDAGLNEDLLTLVLHHMDILADLLESHLGLQEETKCQSRSQFPQPLSLPSGTPPPPSHFP